MSLTKSRPGSLRVPRLRMKEELLLAVPELRRLLGEESFTEHTEKGGQNNSRLDAPVWEERTEEEELNMELEAVKKERAQLMGSLAQIKMESGKAGGEMQAEDVRRLRRELELKKEKLNELRQESGRHEGAIARLQLVSKDCSNLMPENQPSEQERIKALQEELKTLDEELIEAEAKNRLYTLLGQRTRREHMSMGKRVQVAREMAEAYAEDHAALTMHMHDARAAKEDAERELAHNRKMYEEAKHDWQRKLKDRRKEVRDMERRQHKEKDREDRKAARQAERDRIEKDKQAKIKMEEDAYEMQLQALQPKLESMEASWYRLHTITGADTPEEVIDYWLGLKSKEENMRELVRLAEVREEHAKQEMAGLLDSRSEMFESTSTPNEAHPLDAIDASARIEEDQRAAAATKKKFMKLRAVCIGAQQGIQSVMSRLDTALADAATLGLGGVSRSSSRRVSRISSGLGGSRPGSFKRRSTTSGGAAQKALQGIPEAAGAKPLVGDNPALFAVTLANDGMGNLIEDAEYFPKLPSLLKDIGQRLGALVLLEDRIKAALQEAEAGAKVEGSDAQIDSELALARGFAERRRTWTGPPWMQSVTRTGMIMPHSLTMKRKKGKKRADAPRPDLHRILGYTGSDAESDGAASSAKDSDDEAEAGEWDGVVDRDFIKHRSAKVGIKRDAVAAGARPPATGAAGANAAAPAAAAGQPPPAAA